MVGNQVQIRSQYNFELAILVLINLSQWHHCRQCREYKSKKMNAMSAVTAMGKHLKPSAKDLIITMSENMSAQEISAATQVPKSTIYHILKDPEKHRHGLLTETRGRPRSLDIHAINVISLCILFYCIFLIFYCSSWTASLR
jgi:hypothetical protein